MVTNLFILIFNLASGFCEPKVGAKSTRKARSQRVGFARRVQGLRSARNRSLLTANEDFEHKHNEEIARKAHSH